MRPDPTLDCQDCGRVIRHLSPAEDQKVADNPYNFVFWCDDCSRSKIEFKFCVPTLLSPRTQEDDDTLDAKLRELISKPVEE